MTPRPRFTAYALAALLLSSAGAARADNADVEQAKGYFKAGAAAYELGDYQAAIQALDAAYRLTPLPAIAFSLAQAERRQYFVSKERAHLTRAIELFNTYLHEVTTGGRRADATDALSQLEPLALAGEKAEVAPASGPQPDKTRLMITCAAPAATVALDNGLAEKAPVIAQVTPGQHRVLVGAPGFFPSERTVSALAGELVPVEITLREQPALVVLHASSEAELHVDGAFATHVGPAERKLELAAGPHRFSFAKPGYHVETVDARLEAGKTRTVVAELHPTEQRIAALVLLAASGASLVGGVVVTALALDRENAAKRFLSDRELRNVTPAELTKYHDAVDERGRMRALAVGSFIASAAALVTGLSLYLLDTPHVVESAPRRVTTGPELQLSLPVPGARVPLAVGTKMRFKARRFHRKMEEEEGFRLPSLPSSCEIRFVLLRLSDWRMPIRPRKR